MTWQPLILPAVFACLWVTVPGLLALSGWRSDWGSKVLFAPLVSVGIIVLTAIGAQSVGIPWGPLPVLIATVVLCAISWTPWLIRLYRDGRHGKSHHSHRAAMVPRRRAASAKAEANAQSTIAKVGHALTSMPAMLVVATVGYWALMLRHIRNFLQTPYAFGQQYDNVFHLNAIRGILDTGRASSLTLQEHITPDSPSQFYPAAWHDIASLALSSVQSVHVSLGTNAAIIAVLLFVWPASIAALLRVTLPRDLLKYAVLPGGVALAAIPAFPFHFLDFGVLYPNFLGYCLVPALVALFITLVNGLARRSKDVPFIVVSGLLGSFGTALAHPTAALVVMLFCSAYALLHCGHAVVSRQWKSAALRGVLTLALCVATVEAWARLRPSGESADTWPPNLTVTQAIGTTFIHYPINGLVQWVTGALLLVGLWAGIRRSLHPLLAFWALSAALHVVASSFERGPLRTALVGVWYSDSERLYGLLGLTTVPLAIAGLAYLASIATAFARALRPPLRYPRMTSLTASALVALAAVLTTQATPLMNNNIERMKDLYAVTATSNTVNTQEMIFIEALPRYLPENAVVWTDSWHGEGLIYAFTGINVTGRHMGSYDSDPSSIYVRDHLNEIDTNPEVCEALRDVGTPYVVRFEGHNVNSAGVQRPGLTHLQKTKGLTVVYRRGNAFLYRVDGCGF